MINSLRISSLELRDEMSPDITPYINDRKVDIILVRLSNELARFKERYITIMDPHVRVLVRLNILRGNTGNISKGKVRIHLFNFKRYCIRCATKFPLFVNSRIALKDEHFYRNGIRTLPERWAKVVANDGQYFE